jgi:glycosyltransferase involved in cell wall biosynthesis
MVVNFRDASAQYQIAEIEMKVAFLVTDNREPDRKYEVGMPYFGTAPEALLHGFTGLPSLEVHVVSCTQQPMQSPAQLADNIFFHSLHVPKNGWLKTAYQGCIRAVRQKLRQIQPDIVHGQGTERDCAISAVLSGYPNVLTIHGNMRLVALVNHASPLSFLWLAARLESFTLPRTNGVVCISHYTHDAVKRLARKTWLVPNAVDVGFFKMQTMPDPTKPALGLCVGTICHRKNQNNFIRALDPLAVGKKFKLIFLGQVEKNNYGSDFVQLVKERAWCQYAGWAGRDELKCYLKEAAFVALPSLEDNCPMVVLEAMAAGVPVLASNIGGVPDLIEHNKTGLLCDPKEPETFRIGVARLMEDRDFARQLAVRAKQEALERFYPDIIARRHVEIYQEVLKK